MKDEDISTIGGKPPRTDIEFIFVNGTTAGFTAMGTVKEVTDAFTTAKEEKKPFVMRPDYHREALTIFETDKVVFGVFREHSESNIQSPSPVKH